MDWNTLLVPVDFSTASRIAFDHALEIVNGENPLILVLNVVDTELIQLAEAHGWGDKTTLTAQLRSRAENELQSYTAPPGQAVTVDTIVSEGVPFVEILRRADDFDVNAILMAKHGHRQRLEGALFGSTAERVLRATTRPVLVLPIPEN